VLNSGKCLWYILSSVMRKRILVLGFFAMAAQAETASSLWSRGYAVAQTAAVGIAHENLRDTIHLDRQTLEQLRVLGFGGKK
jgi:hypothetical protein